MNRFDQLPKVLQNKIYEYNADHRPQWKDVMRDLIMYDSEDFMLWLEEPGDYTSHKLARAYKSTYNLMDMDLITWQEYRNTSYKIVKKCKELYSDDYLCNTDCPLYYHMRNCYNVQLVNGYGEVYEFNFCRFKNLTYMKPHIIEIYDLLTRHSNRVSVYEIWHDCFGFDVEEVLAKDSFVLHKSKRAPRHQGNQEEIYYDS